VKVVLPGEVASIAADGRGRGAKSVLLTPTDITRLGLFETVSSRVPGEEIENLDLGCGLISLGVRDSSGVVRIFSETSDDENVGCTAAARRLRFGKRGVKWQVEDCLGTMVPWAG
jgi:hypothetical protein